MTDDGGSAAIEAVDVAEAVDRAEAGGPELGLGDLVVAGAVLFALIANSPDLWRGVPILLTAVVWPVGAVGVVSLAVLARRGDRAARWGAAFLAWGLVAVFWSAQSRLAFDGGWGADRGWVYFAAYLGWWAIGRRRGSHGVRWITGALLVGLAANALLAYAQVAIDGEGLAALYRGRAQGFTQNPVFLGALMSGGTALAAALAGRARRWWLPVPLVVAFAAAGNLAGSRVALAGIVVLAPLATWCGAAPQRALRTAAVAGAVAVGILVGSVGGTDSGIGRLDGAGQAGGGLTSRSEMWKAGAGAIAESPVTGWGPNRFRAATNPRVTLAFARSEGDDSTFADAHNLVVELGVATGLPGLVAAGGFAWYAIRRARGPLAWYAAGVALTWTVEPLSITTVPLALLALGLAAVPADPATPPDPPPARRRVRVAAVTAATVLALLAGAASARLVAADARLAVLQDTALDSPDATGVAEARDVSRSVPGDPALHNLYARLLAASASTSRDPEELAEAMAAAQRSTEIDPAYFLAWVDLATVRRDLGPGTETQRNESARFALLEALERSPWSRNVLSRLLAVDRELGRSGDVAVWTDKLCALDACPDD